MLPGFALPPRVAYQRRLCGFNLIEAAIVLAIVGAVLGGIWVAARAVQTNNEVNNYMVKLGRILNDVQENFGREPMDLSGTRTSAYLLAKGYYTSADVKTGALFWAPEFGSKTSYIEYSYQTPGMNGEGLQIRVWNVSRSRCRPMISRMKPFLKEVTFLGTTYTPQSIVDSAITNCESTGFLLIQFNNMLPR